MRCLKFVWSLGFVALLWGCGDDDAGVGPGDSGSLAEAGDGSSGVDAGDAAATPDAGDAGDASTTTDGGDASTTIDAGSSCGDSTVDYARGEECDDGRNDNGDGCSATCRREVTSACGDGTLDLDAAEQCDDGSNVAGDGCSATCQFERVGASCGDNTVDTGETCDDGDTNNGDACNPTCNFANTTSLFVGMVGSAGFTDATGTAAQLGGNGTLAADATHLWFADSSNFRIRRIEVSTGVVVTIAGDGMNAFRDDASNGLNARFGGVEAITTDGTTVWVADRGRIRAVAAAAPHGVVTVAGQGPGGTYQAGNGTAASFGDLRGLTYYAGKVYFVDANAGVLGSFDPATGDVVTLAGTAYTVACPAMAATPTDGIGSAATFCSPRYMASDNSGVLYIADTNGNTIRAYNTVSGAVTTFAGSGLCGYIDGTGTASAVHRPRGMTSDGTSIYWVEFNAHTIRQGVLATRAVSTMIGTQAACTAACSCATPPTGSYAEGTGTAAQLNSPFSTTYHFPSRSLFFVDAGNAVIRRIQ